MLNRSMMMVFQMVPTEDWTAKLPMLTKYETNLTQMCKQSLNFDIYLPVKNEKDCYKNQHLC